MEIRESARKHGVADEDIEHAVANALKFIELEQYGEDRLLVIGPSRTGDLLEIIGVPADEMERVIHADRLRSKFLDFLR